MTFQFNIFFVANELLLSKYYWCRKNLTMLYSSLIFNFSATLIKLQWFDNNKQGILFFFFFLQFTNFTHTHYCSRNKIYISFLIFFICFCKSNWIFFYFSLAMRIQLLQQQQKTTITNDDYHIIIPFIQICKWIFWTSYSTGLK